ncbi:uncharacterized protein LOC124262382 [Haliotis rubra]|uniref:uncharacterized protein LOC124262382 n=1 Tax=Haliotis rubra TaxID=36100 RepID=UPI001EE530F4|nr:uncharacterized protein LOC124262382 [Haliotis rubra]
MHFILFTGVLVLSCVGLICCGTCFNASSVLEVDAHMEHYVFRKVRSPSVYSCASECLMSSVCMSFNFETWTRTCGLNSNSSNDVAITSHPGCFFSDIRYWPKLLAGACSETPCPMSRCHVDRLSRVSCETEFQGCGAPPTVANAEVHYDGVYEGAVSVYTCRDNFMLCTTSNSRICQSTGHWNGSIGSCAQYIWDTPFQQGIVVQLVLPCGNSRNFTVVVNVTPTAGTRVQMDFRRGENILCHIGFRLDENKLAFNSFTSGVWGTQTDLSPVPLAVGTESLVEIRLDQGMYMLAVNGSSIHNFTDMYPDEIIEEVYVSGQAIVSAAHITV